MSFKNRMGNVHNQYQTNTKRVLCVCSAGLLRSPTAANALHKHYGYNTRSCGCENEYALIPIDEVLIEWADEIVFMEHNHKTIVEEKLNIPPNTEAKVLGVEDIYDWGDKRLSALIIRKYKENNLE